MVESIGGSMNKTLYIVDDHRMLLRGLKDYLEDNTDWRVPCVCSTSAECLDSLSKASCAGNNSFPQIIIVDVQLIDENGFSLVQEITKKYPEIKCVMYSMYDTAGYVMQAKAAGVKGYISKVATEEELVRCLEEVFAGGEYFEQKAEDSLAKLKKIDPLLTKQEKKILEKLLQDKTNENISNELFISTHTVENYVSYIYDKLCVKNRAELAALFSK